MFYLLTSLYREIKKKYKLIVDLPFSNNANITDVALYTVNKQ